MAIYEQDVVMFETKENGDKVIKMPISRANNIEGIGRSANTAYAVGDVVYVDNNKKVALKCTTSGTTSNTELDISTKNIGDTVIDGTVKWQVVGRDLSADVSNLQDDLKKEKEKVQTIELGGTNATTPKEALANLGGISSVSGINADTNGDANVFETQLGHTASGGSYLMVKNYASRVFEVFFYEPIYVSRSTSSFTINLPFPLPNPCLAWAADLSASFDGKTHLTGVSTTSYSGVFNIFSGGGAGLNATQYLRGYFMGEL